MAETIQIPSDFWEQSDYASNTYSSPPFDDETLSSIQVEIGYGLPASFVALMRTQNGGAPRRTCYRTKSATSWATDHIAVTGLYGIGRSKPNSLGGEFCSKFWNDEWGYPQIGVYFADCPSAGHDMLCLDYRVCGKDGEPMVVHVDQARDYTVTVLANSFQEFILGLEPEENFDAL